MLHMDIVKRFNNWLKSTGIIFATGYGKWRFLGQTNSFT